MSQYPSPYTPPPPQQPNYGAGGYDFSYYQPTEDLLGPARRASIMMFVLGGLTLLLGACNLASSLVVPAEQILAQNEAILQGQPSPLSAGTLKTISLVMAILVCVVGFTFILLGTMVRRGGMGSIIATMLIAGAIAILLLFMLVISLIGIVAVSPVYAGLACVVVIPLSLYILLLWWLVQAAKAAPRVAMMKSQYQQQMWAYQQQQQMYQQAGYPAPPTPAAPVPPGLQQPFSSTMPPPPIPPPPPPAPRVDDPSRGDPNGPAV
jgi:hypothetical protein